MNESYLKGILAEICEEEIAELNKFPIFRPSLRHRLAMKRIFSLFEKNTRQAVSEAPTPSLTLQHKNLRLSKRLTILFVIIICAALLTGFITGYFSKKFYGAVYGDNTQLFAVNAENCPATIEYEYCLSDLPDGFEIIEHNFTQKSVFIQYENTLSGQGIRFNQYTKDIFEVHYNTEHHNFEEIEINGCSGLSLDFNDDEHFGSIIIWDNGDYILEISGDLTKIDLLNLAESAKVLKN